MNVKVKIPSPPAAACMFLVLLLAAAHPAYAHKMMAFAYIEGGKVHVEGYFADGKKTIDSLVEVFDEEGAKILEGKTGPQGAFSFPAPAAARLRIVLTGSMGHRAECFVQAGEAQQERGDAPARSAPVLGPQADEETAAGREYLREIVAQEIDRKLAPLLQEIRALRRSGPSVSEILGGIGYVIGIMGLIMYFKARSSRGS